MTHTTPHTRNEGAAHLDEKALEAAMAASGDPTLNVHDSIIAAITAYLASAPAPANPFHVYSGGFSDFNPRTLNLADVEIRSVYHYGGENGAMIELIDIINALKPLAKFSETYEFYLQITGEEPVDPIHSLEVTLGSQEPVIKKEYSITRSDLTRARDLYELLRGANCGSAGSGERS